MTEISPEYLRSILTYYPDNGLLFWKYREDYYKRWNVRYANNQAFNVTSDSGYYRGSINKRWFQAHRVAWAIHYGEWPSDILDHINMVKTDNRICNLRIASKSKNAMNIRKHSDNRSGYKGVDFSKVSNKWRARIMKLGVNYNLGFFDSKEEAYEAYCIAASNLHKEFKRTK